MGRGHGAVNPSDTVVLRSPGPVVGQQVLGTSAWENLGMARKETPDDGLAHIVVCGGTPGEWSALGHEGWTARISTLAEGASRGGVRFVTVVPHHGTGDPVDEEVAAGLIAEVDGASRSGDRVVFRPRDGLTLVIDTVADGHRRFSAVVDGLRTKGVDISEEAISAAVLAPAVGEPDLVLILGKPDEVPPSLVWELAYSELVFLDIAWADLQAVHVEMAIDDFGRRHRRFGGLDS